MDPIPSDANTEVVRPPIDEDGLYGRTRSDIEETYPSGSNPSSDYGPTRRVGTLVAQQSLEQGDASATSGDGEASDEPEPTGPTPLPPWARELAAQNRIDPSSSSRIAGHALNSRIIEARNRRQR